MKPSFTLSTGLLVPLLAVLVSSCSLTGPEPETLNERVVAVAVELDTAYRQISLLADSGVIGENTAPALLEYVEATEAALNAARIAVAAGDVRETETQVLLANRLLLGLTARLAQLQDE